MLRLRDTAELTLSKECAQKRCSVVRWLEENGVKEPGAGAVLREAPCYDGLVQAAEGCSFCKASLVITRY